MRKLAITALSASALLLGVANAAPKSTPAPDKVSVNCDVTVKDANGKVVSERNYRDQVVGVRHRARSNALYASLSSPMNTGYLDTVIIG